MKSVCEYTVLLLISLVFPICQGHPAELQKVVVDDSIQKDKNSCDQHLANYSSALELNELWALKSKAMFQIINTYMYFKIVVNTPFTSYRRSTFLCGL